MAEKMKCVCGYTPKYEFDPEFIESEGYVSFKLGKPKTMMTIGTNPNDVKIYACPKCGTLKIKI